MKVRHGRYAAMLIGLCVLATLACQAATFFASGDESNSATGDSHTTEELAAVEPAADDPATEAVEALEITPAQLAEALAVETVDERPEVLALLGRPDAFKMSVLDVEGGQIRQETWWYFQLGTQIDFVDGETVWTLDLEPAPEGSIFPAWYDPLTFEPGMPAVDVIQLAAAASPAGAVPEIIDVSEGGEDLAGGLILVGDQIMIGVQDDRVVYVETVPLFAEEGQS